MTQPAKPLKLILQRQGIGDMIRTSDNCPLYGRGYYTEIKGPHTPPKRHHGEWLPFLGNQQIPGSDRINSERFATPEAARHKFARMIGSHLGRPVEFEPWVEAYSWTGMHGEKFIMHALYEPQTETVRLHRSNVCLAIWERGYPVPMMDDGANRAFRSIVEYVCAMKHGTATDDRHRIAYLISSYIGQNLPGCTRDRGVPVFDHAPTFPLDLTPGVYDSMEWRRP